MITEGLLNHFSFDRKIEEISVKEDQYMIVGTMKDEKLKLRGLHVSYTLGYSGEWNT
jgi:hypothetical protein